MHAEPRNRKCWICRKRGSRPGLRYTKRPATFNIKGSLVLKARPSGFFTIKTHRLCSSLLCTAAAPPKSSLKKKVGLGSDQNHPSPTSSSPSSKLSIHPSAMGPSELSLKGTHGLVAEADQVIGESRNGLRGAAGLGGLAVVADEDGLFRRDDDDALLALRCVKFSVSARLLQFLFFFFSRSSRYEEGGGEDGGSVPCGRTSSGCPCRSRPSRARSVHC